MNLLATNPILVASFVSVVAVFLAGCGGPDDTNGPTGPAEPPPSGESKGVVSEDEGRVAAELFADPEEVPPGGEVLLQVVNHGEVPLSYGRPIAVEWWNGMEWEETSESREAVWTMEMLTVSAGETGVEQRWPFQPDQQPEPGWYRFTKSVQAERDNGESVQLDVRTRVNVTD